ncbi:hypothetical protein FR483_n653L [Paramecium bursaria Chlorella virus FR483]|uniref:Uncharacterized protein n653L n=1 Tax=Paramecium bursaria Chlorella virus FR483 TaxID=399781 RepID=A7J807_PBCVF|nr:hypothetical protein FR483_n653L [Paramecium bursaria Chlorella virus FR483]ABT15938.1 hypothetical protein FR483_n653L [Paramecium bursaria Chlorella virus FR483]
MGVCRGSAVLWILLRNLLAQEPWGDAWPGSVQRVHQSRRGSAPTVWRAPVLKAGEQAVSGTGEGNCGGGSCQRKGIHL